MPLHIHQLSCRRGGRTVFADLSFQLPAGGIAHVRGVNGAGKSSLLAIIAGFLPPDQGEVTLGDSSLPPSRYAEQIAWLGHTTALKPALTLRQNLLTWLRILGRPSDALEPALVAFDLAPRADTPARFCSAGERQRAALARIVAADRPLWLLDEPTTALDQAGRDCLTHALTQHAAAGGIAIIATHSAIEPRPTATIQLGPRAEDSLGQLQPAERSA